MYFDPIFPAFWTHSSHALSQLYALRRAYVHGNIESLEKVWTKLSDPHEWSRPLELKDTSFHKNLPKVSREAIHLPVLVDGAKIRFPTFPCETLDVVGGKVEVDFARSVYWILAQREWVGDSYSSDVWQGILKWLKDVNRTLFIPVLMRAGSQEEAKFVVWRTGFDAERYYGDAERYYGELGQVTFKILAAYPRNEQPMFCDLSKYMANDVKLEWSASTMAIYLSREFLGVEDSDLRSVLVKIFPRTKIPQNLKSWTKCRILKELYKHRNELVRHTLLPPEWES